MRAIYKYPIAAFAGAVTRVKMPLSFQFLKVEKQGSSAYFWALVDLSSQDVDRVFRVMPTGAQIESKDEYRYTFLGTWLDHPYVWHLFMDAIELTDDELIAEPSNDVPPRD